jgi:hypothetical protein
MGITYEVLLWRPNTSGKRKVEIREFIRDGDQNKETRRKSCEVDAGNVKLTSPDFENVHLKEADNVIECVMTLRRLGLDDCADNLEDWIREMGGKGEDE